ncbi:MAG: Hsp20/alpha crystallin family protein [SAR324 cluster bacterium]|nr:Hsp20/alpha crystallin family protein [SAR324 cluster bacterium]
MNSDLDSFVQRSTQLGEQIESLHRRGKSYVDDSHNDSWQPLFDLYHHQNYLFIDIELPGLPPSAVEVVSDPELVVVKGHKPTSKDLPEREDIVAAREYGQFASQFAMPPGYRLKDLDRRMENGVLHLKIEIEPRPSPDDRP